MILNDRLTEQEWKAKIVHRKAGAIKAQFEYLAKKRKQIDPR